MQSEKIAVTGVGCICAGCTSPEELWEVLRQGVRRVGTVPAWLFPTELDFPVFCCNRNVLSDRARVLLEETPWEVASSELNRTILLTLSAASQALESAGLTREDLQEVRVGIALGTTVGCTFNNEDCYYAWSDGKEADLTPLWQYLTGNLSAVLHAVLGTRGPSVVVTNACASGTDAIGIARNWIRSGRCDLAIAGGADELSRIAYNGFASLQLLSQGPCRPFDKDRQGLNLGEGAGVLVLEPMEQAQKRGGRPVGYVRGYGMASDAWHPTAPHPEGRGLLAAIRAALADAGLSLEDIAYVNAHGTGTQANDEAESRALSTLFGQEAPPIVSTKGVTGHTLGAAGALETILTLLALQKGESGGTVGCMEIDPSLSVGPVIHGENRELKGTVGLNQSLAFGGGNAALVIEACGEREKGLD